MDLYCTACDWRTRCGPAAMIERLREARMLRAGVEADPELLGELFRSAAPRCQCPQCGHSGLATAPASDDEFDWPEARRCSDCGAMIPSERLEVFPDTRLCVKCQSGDEHGHTPDAAEYCPRCGTVMRLTTTTRGITRHVMTCPKCRR
jgi:hypothetical protein